MGGNRVILTAWLTIGAVVLMLVLVHVGMR